MATAVRVILPAVSDDLDLVDQAEFYRLDAGRFLTDAQRAELGDFLTPAPGARFMARLPPSEMCIDPCGDLNHV